LVEHATENRSVGGSIPPLGTIGHANVAAAYIAVLKINASAVPADHAKRQRSCELALRGKVVLRIYKRQHGSPISHCSQRYSHIPKKQFG
jgi:hypothetical protein